MSAFSIGEITNAVLPQFEGQVSEIVATEIQDSEGKPDADHNHYIDLILPSGEKLPASIFALKLNGEPKEKEACVQELAQKIEQFLQNRGNTSFIHLPSGTWIDPTGAEGTEIGVEEGRFTIDGKAVVFKKEDKYQPLLGKQVQSYTSSTVAKEGPLLIITDEHAALRTDGKEGFIFNLEQPLTLKKEELVFHPNDQAADSTPEEGEYLLLFRTREEALRR